MTRDAVITTANRSADAELLLYGLRLRGICAEVRPAPPNTPDAWRIVADPETAARAARVIDAVWDAVLDFPLALTPAGDCPFCRYDVRGLPHRRDRPFPCPECGVDLASIPARRAFREGRSPPRPG